MIIRWAALIAALLFGWIGIMTLVMRFSDAAPAAVILFPSNAMLAALPDDLVILSDTSFTLTVKSDEPSLGRRLYNSGALLVLPAGLTGCLPLPHRQSTVQPQ